MNNPAKIASLITLFLVTVPSLLYFAGAINLEVVKWTALAGTIGWFAATPIWMSRDLPDNPSSVDPVDAKV